MSRRILSTILVLGFLFISSLFLTKTSALAQVPTATPSPTSPAEFVGSPLSGPAPLTVQFTHIGNNGPDQYCAWVFGDGTQQIFNALATGANPFPVCPPALTTYIVPGTFSPSLTAFGPTGTAGGTKFNFNYVQVPGPTPTATQVNPPVPDLWIHGTVFFNSSPPCPDNPRVQLQISHIGPPVTTPFQVTFNGETRTVNGITQAVSLDFFGVFGTKTVVIDTTNVIAEANESNNSKTFLFPAQNCGGPSATPTRTTTPTRTNTPSGPTPTRTRTPIPPTATRTPTPGSGTCSPVNATITAPFTFDGAGTFCWQSSNLGGFINNWNMTSLTMNGVNMTNMFVASGSYPAKINGFWYVSYNSTGAFGHFETK